MKKFAINELYSRRNELLEILKEANKWREIGDNRKSKFLYAEEKEFYRYVISANPTTILENIELYIDDKNNLVDLSTSIFGNNITVLNQNKGSVILDKYYNVIKKFEDRIKSIIHLTYRDLAEPHLLIHFEHCSEFLIFNITNGKETWLPVNSICHNFSQRNSKEITDGFVYYTTNNNLYVYDILNQKTDKLISYDEIENNYEVCKIDNISKQMYVVIFSNIKRNTKTYKTYVIYKNSIIYKYDNYIDIDIKTDYFTLHRTPIFDKHEIVNIRFDGKILDDSEFVEINKKYKDCFYPSNIREVNKLNDYELIPIHNIEGAEYYTLKHNGKPIEYIFDSMNDVIGDLIIVRDELFNASDRYSIFNTKNNKTIGFVNFSKEAAKSIVNDIQVLLK